MHLYLLHYTPIEDLRAKSFRNVLGEFMMQQAMYLFFREEIKSEFLTDDTWRRPRRSTARMTNPVRELPYFERYTRGRLSLYTLIPSFRQSYLRVLQAQQSPTIFQGPLNLLVQQTSVWYPLLCCPTIAWLNEHQQ